MAINLELPQVDATLFNDLDRGSQTAVVNAMVEGIAAELFEQLYPPIIAAYENSGAGLSEFLKKVTESSDEMINALRAQTDAGHDADLVDIMEKFSDDFSKMEQDRDRQEQLRIEQSSEDRVAYTNIFRSIETSIRGVSDKLKGLVNDGFGFLENLLNPMYIVSLLTSAAFGIAGAAASTGLFTASTLGGLILAAGGSKGILAKGALATIGRFGPVGALAAGIGLAAWDAIIGWSKSDDWNVSKISGALGSLLTIESDKWSTRFFGNVIKFGAIGAGAGLIGGPVGVIAGALVGAIIGTLFSVFKPQELALKIDALIAGGNTLMANFMLKLAKITSVFGGSEHLSQAEIDYIQAQINEIDVNVKNAHERTKIAVEERNQVQKEINEISKNLLALIGSETSDEYKLLQLRRENLEFRKKSLSDEIVENEKIIAESKPQLSTLHKDIIKAQKTLTKGRLKDAQRENERLKILEEDQKHAEKAHENWKKLLNEFKQGDFSAFVPEFSEEDKKWLRNVKKRFNSFVSDMKFGIDKIITLVSNLFTKIGDAFSSLNDGVIKLAIDAYKTVNFGGFFDDKIQALQKELVGAENLSTTGPTRRGSATYRRNQRLTKEYREKQDILAKERNERRARERYLNTEMPDVFKKTIDSTEKTLRKDERMLMELQVIRELGESIERLENAKRQKDTLSTATQINAVNQSSHNSSVIVNNQSTMNAMTPLRTGDIRLMNTGNYFDAFYKP